MVVAGLVSGQRMMAIFTVHYVLIISAISVEFHLTQKPGSEVQCIRQKIC